MTIALHLPAMQDLLDTGYAEAGARPTPLPPLDLDARVRDSESGLHSLPERETSPPPPLYPASLGAMPPPPLVPGCAPSPLETQMHECARRAELLATTLRVGALSREEAGRVLRTELDALEVGARRTSLSALRMLALRVRDVIEELAGIAEESVEVGREVLVLDADPATAALVALALEAHGHFARRAANLADLARVPVEANLRAIFMAMDFPGADLGQPFCRRLPEMVQSEGIPVVVYGRASEMRLAAIAERVEADAALRIDTRVEDLVPAIGALLERVLVAQRSWSA
jgi:CheY-like chemotaxis protein